LSSFRCIAKCCSERLVAHGQSLWQVDRCCHKRFFGVPTAVVPLESYGHYSILANEAKICNIELFAASTCLGCGKAGVPCILCPPLLIGFHLFSSHIRPSIIRSICSGCRFQARSVFAVPMTVADSSDVARKLGIKHLRTCGLSPLLPGSPLSSITNGFKYYGVGIRTHLDDRWGSNRFAEVCNDRMFLRIHIRLLFDIGS